MAARRGDLADAEAVYRKLIQLDPRSAEWHNNLGVTYVRQEKIRRGIEAFRAALQLAPYYAEAHLNLAVALEWLGEGGEATTHYRSFLALAGEGQSQERERVERYLASGQGG
jgi:Flp pilus assembly protein TadD